jgi:hypothetical protein
MQSIKNNFYKLFFLLLSQIGIAQFYPSKNITTLDGLSNNSVNTIYKDSRGLVWVGTQNGVNVLQGNTVINLKKNDGLAHETCWDIAEDSNHNMWFASFGGGMCTFDGKKFKVFNTQNGLVNNFIRKLFAFKNKILVGTSNGLSIIDINSNKIFNFYNTDKKEPFQVMAFFNYKGDVYCTTYRSGVFKVDLDKPKLSFLSKNKECVLSAVQYGDYVFSGSDIFGTTVNKSTVAEYLKNKKPIQSFGDTFFWKFIKDKRGTLYGGADGVKFPTGGIFKIGDNQLHNMNLSFGVESHSVWGLEYDKALDRLYLGTSDHGLYEINLDNQIKHFDKGQFKRTNLEIKEINHLHDSKIFLHSAGILATTLKDELRFNVEKNTFFRYMVNYHILNHINPIPTIDQIEFRHLKINDDKIIVTTSVGLFWMNQIGKIIDFIPLNSGAIDFISPTKILYHIPYRTVNVLTKNKSTISETAFDLNNKNNPRDIVEIIKIKSAYFLISRFYGLYKYENGKFISYANSGIWKEKELLHLTKNKHNNIIVSNASGDVFVLDISNKFKIIQRIDHAQLYGSSISFLESFKDYVIVGTEKGVNICRNGKIQLVDQEQGLKNTIFTSAHILNNNLIIGAQNGYYALDIARYTSAPKTNRQVKISKIEINFKPIETRNFKWFSYTNSQISLPYDQNTISISYYPEKHPYPNKLTYRYKLIGLDSKDWSNWDTNSSINIPYLPSGNFMLRLEIKDKFSGNTYSQDLIQVVITPPFWKTWWFILGLVVSVSILIYVVYRKRISYIQKQAENQNRLVETKMEALQSQMNPHFIFNAMNSIQFYIIKKNTDDAIMYLGEFSKIIRDTLNNSSKFKISLQEEIDFLNSYIILENMRFDNRVSFEIQVDISIDISKIQIPPMLLQPFIENVFAHAFNETIANPTLQIRFSLMEGSLICEIIDNGIGMGQSGSNKLFESKGIKLVKERIGLFQKSASDPIIFSTTKGGGTHITLRISVQE